MSDKPVFQSAVRRYLLRVQRRHAIPVMVVPALGTLGLVLLRWQPSPFRVGLFAVLYVLSMLGITVGFHRYLTHGGFSCGKPLRIALAILGCLAAEGSPTFWVANHRRHHQFSDEPGDPHSPLLGGRSFTGRVRAFAHAHLGWMLSEPPADPLRYAPDLLRDPTIAWINRRYLWFVFTGVLGPALLGWAVLGGALGFIDGLLWGGLARLFAAQHVTWAINSVCHVLGGRSYDTRDGSRNNFVLGIFALGEGWHNNHHAEPSSARHGFRWWQLDLSFWFISVLRALGLISDVRVADLKRLEQRTRFAPSPEETA